MSENFEIKYQINKGGFGDIFLGFNSDNNTNVLIKLEYVNSCKKSSIINEYIIYKELDNTIYFPKIYSYYNKCNTDILVMELNGPNLQQVYKYCNKQFSLKTILMLFIQLLKRVQYIHSKYIIHCDIKPNNIILGNLNNLNIIKLIDFGLSHKYYDINSNTHIKFKSNKFKGTTTFCSINALKEFTLGRKDDLECLGYTMIYLLTNTLPWNNLLKKDVLNKKILTSIDELCSNCPNEFNIYMNYIKLLKFNEQPNYDFLILLFHTLFITKNYKYDNKYDWITL